MITAMGDVMREAYKRGWITTRDGNVSLKRKNSDIMYITPSGWRKTIIHPEHMVKVKLIPSGFEMMTKHAKPSGELSMHGFLQRSHNKTKAVVHLHPTYCTAAMYRGWQLCDIVKDFPEVFRYTKVGPNVPKLEATSHELAQATFDAMTYADTNKIIYDIVGQECHGVTAIAGNPWDAFEHIERVEHICKIVLAAS